MISRFFLKRLRKISEKRLRVVEIFDTLKKHKKIHALSAWSFRFLPFAVALLLILENQIVQIHDEIVQHISHSSFPLFVMPTITSRFVYFNYFFMTFL